MYVVARTTQKWFARFKKRSSFLNKPRSGQSSGFDKEGLKIFVCENQQQKTRELPEKTDMFTSNSAEQPQ